ncbi:MAG: PTS sugar transporter subunit IIA [bacterium]
MKIMDFLCPEAIIVDINATDKKGAITEIVEVLKTLNKIKNSSEVVDTLLQREKLGSTGIGQGVAIPHSKIDSLTKQSSSPSGIIGALGISRQGINFDALDGGIVHLIFLLICSPENSGEHLQAMACVSRLFRNKSVKNAILNATTPAEVLSIIQKINT